MKIRVLLVAALLPACAGCFTVSLYAPHGADVTLVSSNAAEPVERRWRTWFVAWGATPLDDTMPAEIIAREKLTHVRVTVEDNIPDALHGILYTFLIPIGLVTQTIVIQGDREPATPDQRK